MIKNFEEFVNENYKIRNYRKFENDLDKGLSNVIKEFEYPANNILDTISKVLKDKYDEFMNDERVDKPDAELFYFIQRNDFYKELENQGIKSSELSTTEWEHLRDAVINWFKTLF